MTSDAPEWRWQLGVGSALVLLTLPDLSGWFADLIAGPWDDATFSQGVLGVVGGCLVYVAWFRWRFGRKGLLPTTDLWVDPRRSVPQVLGVGAVLLFIGWGMGQWMDDVAPGPASLLVLLVGFLTVLVGAYAWLVVLGPLADPPADDEADIDAAFDEE